MGSILQLKRDGQSVEISEQSVKMTYDEYKNIFNESRLLIEENDASEILRRLIILLREIVKFSSLGLLLKEKYSDDFYLYYDYEIDKNVSGRIRWLEKSGYIEWACKEERVVIIPDEDGRKENQSMALVPLLSGKNIIGILIIFLKLHTNEFTSRKSDLLFLVGTQAASALQNAFLYKDMALKNQAMANMKNFLENSLESMADGLFALDLENKISLINTTASKYFGISPVEAIGSKINKIFAPEFAKYLKESLQKTYIIGSFEGQFNYVNPIDEKIFPLGIHLSILKNTEKEQIGVIGICRDMTEREELFHLRKLDQLKDEFISSISHELRTPLTSIKSFTEILLEYDTQDKKTQKEFLSIIEKETNRLIDLVNDLLDLSRMSQSEFSIKKENVIINDVFQEAYHSVKVLAEKKNIIIETNFDPNNKMVVGDSTRLIQVFVNLIGNAIKFSPEESVIKIWSKPFSGKRLVDRSDFLQIAVEDYGEGIPKKYFKAIFEKFKQVSSDAATKPAGSGLGLPICKRIVERLGGNIWVESEIKKGSTFFFTLPLVNERIERHEDAKAEK